MVYKKQNNYRRTNLEVTLRKSAAVVCVVLCYCLNTVLLLASQEGSNQLIIVAPPPEIESVQDKVVPVFPDKPKLPLPEKPQLPSKATKETVADKAPQAFEPVATATPPIELQEFKADHLSGKPALDEIGQKIHFYSDPAPLINEPRVEREEDAALRQLERERAFPIIDAPAGLYDFSASDGKLGIIASHSYTDFPIKAGQNLGIDFLLTNHNGQKFVLTEGVIAPPGARTAYGIAAFEVLPGQTIRRRVSLFLDSAIAPGIHEACYQLQSEPGKEAVSQLKFRFAINSLPELIFKLTSAARINEAAPFKVLGTLENNGNVDLHLALTVVGRAENLKIMPGRISLPVGAQAIIEITGVSPAKSHPLDNSLLLNFSAVAEQESGNLKLLEQQLKFWLASPQAD
jgi:hypothetical protein